MRSLRRGGGVGIMIKKDLSPKIHDELSIFNESIYESIVVSACIGNKIINFVSIYKPPKNDDLNITQLDEIFHSTFSNHMRKLKSLNGNIFIGSDFNINLLNCGSENSPTVLLANCIENNLNILNSLPTRPSASGESATLIDYLISDIETSRIVSLVNLLESPSDHLI